MNNNFNVPSDSEFRDEMTVSYAEVQETCDYSYDMDTDTVYEDESNEEAEAECFYWDGVGSGEDDLADLMAYGDEGCCDGPEDDAQEDCDGDSDVYDSEPDYVDDTSYLADD